MDTPNGTRPLAERSTEEIESLLGELLQRQSDEQYAGDADEARRFGVLIEHVTAELRKRRSKVHALDSRRR
jgi:hypothetical protein